LTEVFGVRGEKGDLRLEPKLVKEQFNTQAGSVTASSRFAGKKISVTYENAQGLDYGAYRIVKASFNGESIEVDEGQSNALTIARKSIEGAPSECTINITLGASPHL
jgi:cellobiose phosphorylase